MHAGGVRPRMAKGAPWRKWGLPWAQEVGNQEGEGEALQAAVGPGASRSLPGGRTQPPSQERGAPLSLCTKQAGKLELCPESWVSSSSVKGSRVNISGFLGHTVSASVTPLCWCSTKTTPESKQANERGSVLIKLDLQK